MDKLKTLPTFIGIGAPKTASTFLDQCLKEHPEVYMPLSKEPHYFSSTFSLGLNVYMEFFSGAQNYACRGEISTSYFHDPHAPERIHQLLPDVKLILSARNPAEQVYSLYWQAKRHNFYQSKDNDINLGFIEALEKYPDILLEPAKYGTHLERWLKYFSRDQIHVVLFDDIKSDIVDTLLELFKFLDVSQDASLQHIRSMNKKVLGGVSPRNRFVGKLYGYVYVVLNKGVFIPLKKHIGYKQALWLKDKLRVRDAMGKLFFKPSYPKINAYERAYILDLFEDEIKALESYLDRDLSDWRSCKKTS